MKEHHSSGPRPRSSAEWSPYGIGKGGMLGLGHRQHYLGVPTDYQQFATIDRPQAESQQQNECCVLVMLVWVSPTIFFLKTGSHSI